ncbi:CTB family bacteriocin [Chlorogloeopsis sp. ULAP02]|uniref:CTB family bacteriocin n=1 Tax=Chlorogloeopsis sp. ULAP02 TaxID=3107926 RepID=UPI0031373154
MSNQDFATELFADVTEEQQQMVAGGSYYGYDGIYFSKFASFFKDVDVKEVTGVVSAGPGGAYSANTILTLSDYTSSYASDFANIK